jgi:uncharacterized membrane protein YcaP (DUF421 family)
VNEAFELTMPIWEIVARTSIVYLTIIFLLRVVPKRRSGSISPNDMIALVLIGALAGDAVLGGSNSIADILLMIAVVVGWGYLFDALVYRFPLVHSLLREPQTALIRDGRILQRNLRRELVTEEELMAALREQGVKDPKVVRTACLEADGQISVIKNDRGK